MHKLNSNASIHLMHEEPTLWKKTHEDAGKHWKAGGRRGGSWRMRWLDGTSDIQKEHEFESRLWELTVDQGSLVLQSIRSKVGQDWVTEWTELNWASERLGRNWVHFHCQEELKLDWDCLEKEARYLFTVSKVLLKWKGPYQTFRCSISWRKKALQLNAVDLTLWKAINPEILKEK